MTTIKKSRIYTKTGDSGTTGLVGGKRVSKAHVRIESYGTVDELNSAIGLLMAEQLPDDTAQFLLWIQHVLFTVGSNLATDPEAMELRQYSILATESIERLEAEIDRLDSTLPRMTGFILPSGGRTPALCHLCRTICRRAERCIYRLKEVSEVDPQVTQFINRLSDYLFVLARVEAIRTNGTEILWDKAIQQNV